jgi:hypothetical protein
MQAFCKISFPPQCSRAAPRSPRATSRPSIAAGWCHLAPAERGHRAARGWTGGAAHRPRHRDGHLRRLGRGRPEPRRGFPADRVRRPRVPRGKRAAPRVRLPLRRDRLPLPPLFRHQRNLGIEALGGLGYAELDLTTSSPLQSASDKLGSGGLVGGFGIVWKFLPRTNLQSRITLFGSGETEGVTGAARWDLHIAPGARPPRGAARRAHRLGARLGSCGRRRCERSTRASAPVFPGSRSAST